MKFAIDKETLRRLATVLLAVASYSAGSVTTASAGQNPATQMATGVVYADANQNRVRDADEKPLSDVRVSNGREVVVTDGEGRYSLSVDNDTIVFVIKPSGYRTVQDQDHLSRFYYIHKPEGSPKLDFPGVDPADPVQHHIGEQAIEVERRRPIFVRDGPAVEFLADPSHLADR